MSGPRVSKPSTKPLTVVIPSKVNLGSVKMTELPAYVQSIAKPTFSLSIPQEYTVLFLEYNMALLKGIKALRSLVLSQMITFTTASLMKLYQQIDKQCKIVWEIIAMFLKAYNEMCVKYFCSVVIINNIKEVNNFFESLKTCYNDFCKLVEKIKDKTIKQKWQNILKTIKIVQATGNGSESVNILNMMTQRVVSPVISCATAIVAYEKEMKNHTRISQYALAKDVEYLKLLRSKTQKELPKVLVLCKSGVEKTLEQIQIEKNKAEKKKNNKQLSKLTELHGQLMEIESQIQLVEVGFRRALNESEQILKVAKYSAGDHVEVLITLKSILKNMVDLAKEAFAIIENPKTTDKQRIYIINLIINKISVCENDIEITVTKITWNKEDDEVGQNTTKVRLSTNKASQKFAKLNSSTEVNKLYSVILQWSKAKPSAVIAFLSKYGKYIIMAIGFIISII